MYREKMIDGVDFYVETDGSDLKFKGIGCTELLRVYGKCHDKYEYAGIAVPDSGGCSLSFSFSDSPEYICITRGRLEDKHDIVCDFELIEKPSAADECGIPFFNHPAALSCVRHYGHFCCFDVSCGKVYAFPSDFFTHPLPGFIRFSYWYDVDLGCSHKGYFLIGISDDNKNFFVTEKVLTEITQGCKI